jgi:hypothetical protein
LKVIALVASSDLCFGWLVARIRRPRITADLEKNELFFLPGGVVGYTSDLLNDEVRQIDGGHFAYGDRWKPKSRTPLLRRGLRLKLPD